MKKNRPQRIDPLNPPKQNHSFFDEKLKRSAVEPIRRQPNHLRLFTQALIILLLVICIGFLYRFMNQSMFGKTEPELETSSQPSAQPSAQPNQPDASLTSQTSVLETASSLLPTNDESPRIAANEVLILNPPRLSVEAAQAYAKARNAHPDFINLAPIFWRVAAEYQVDPLVAYCQSALETNFMHFTGILTREFCNPCGMKTTVGGEDNDQQAHMRFPDWETGIRAQVQHLALYAGGENTPVKTPVDPRHFPYLKGTAPSVESLSKKWAPSEKYGQSIREMMEEALKFSR